MGNPAMNSSGLRSAADGSEHNAVPINPVARLLSTDDILLDAEASTKTRVFEEIARLIERRHGFSKAQVVENLCARESLGSTGLGHGVAIPHARIKGLQRAVVAYVRTRLSVPFDALDGKPVSDMLVLLMPEQATDEHLQLLAWSAQMFGDRGFREQLRMCEAPGEVRQLFTAWPQS
jgi:PTS system nitrogen regulatory IIA component